MYLNIRSRLYEKNSIERAVDRVLAYYQNNGFSRTTVFVYRKLGKELLQELEEEGSRGIKKDLENWLARKLAVNKNHYPSLIKYNRYVQLLLDVMESGDSAFSNVQFLRVAKSVSTRTWEKVLDDYLEEMQREGKAKATISFSRRACTKFILYLEQQGCLTPSALSRELVLRYQDEEGGHSTLNGRRAYLYRIRMFIRYLQRKEMVEQTLEFVINTHFRIPHKAVTVLTEQQESKINGSRRTNIPIHNRSFAMVTLALYMGLRTSDILNLEFSDISWTDSTVTIIQQKTKVPLVLPLPAIAGNAVADYVLNHRPKSNSPYIFVSHRAPHGRLTKNACNYAMILLLGDIDEQECPKGLHILRRTFASRLLNSNVSHGMVSNILGHRDPESITRYLSLDEEKMGRCTLELSLVGKPEVLG